MDPFFKVDVSDGNNGLVRLTPFVEPPSRHAVSQWLESEKRNERKKPDRKKLYLESKKGGSQVHDRSQIEQATMNNSFGFKVSFGNCHEAKAVHQVRD